MRDGSFFFLAHSGGRIRLRKVHIGIASRRRRLVWCIGPILDSEKSSIWIGHMLHNRDTCPNDQEICSIIGRPGERNFPEYPVENCLPPPRHTMPPDLLEHNP